MKAAKKCQTCKQKFNPARSDAKYCSSACKMSAYHRRKKNVPIVTTSEHQAFFMDEYEAVLKEMSIDSEILPLIIYCFFRKNLKGHNSIEQIISYFNAVWPALTKVENSDVFHSFQEQFFSGVYAVETHPKVEHNGKEI